MRIVLDIDDTWDEAHGAQRLSLFNARHDGYGFPPIHVYDDLPPRSGPPLMRESGAGLCPAVGAEA